MATLAPALVTLRNQFNALAPGRSKLSDGWLGDPAHRARVSDHNPDRYGFVHATDTTVDLRIGFDPHAWAERQVLRGPDPRVKYFISKGRIWVAGRDPVGIPHSRWRRYTGSNSHTLHLHVSTRASLDRDGRPWAYIDDNFIPPFTVPLPIDEPAQGELMTEMIKHPDTGGHAVIIGYEYYLLELADYVKIGDAPSNFERFLLKSGGNPTVARSEAHWAQLLRWTDSWNEERAYRQAARADYMRAKASASG